MYPATLGALRQADGKCEFCVWASRADEVALQLFEPTGTLVPMSRDDRGYWSVSVENVSAGQTYQFLLNGNDARPDPASRFQPQGVHQPSAVVDRQFPWSDQAWHGLPLVDYITYELHTGTFTEAGTFDAAIERIPDLLDLGITAIELLPVAQFPGERNWGYDGVHPYAAQNSYGGPDGLRRFVDACHQAGLAVVLDVVYNHLGPEGNYLGQFGDYFTSQYKTPWGDALNFDGPRSDEVRRYFIENALWWIADCHIDALRLDAVHAIYDQSAYPFLQELADVVRLEGVRLNRQVHLIAESHLNDPKLVSPAEIGGWGLDSQWADDLHHAIHVTLTGERSGYYSDFDGFAALAKCYRDGFTFDGQYSPYRKHRYGKPSSHLQPVAFTVFSQNHDQIGNRLSGDRLPTQLEEIHGVETAREMQKLAAALVLLSPYSPMLFMGEEYGEPAPFQYFVSHLDEHLVKAVRDGRKREFQAFGWQIEPPDPQAEATFRDSTLNHELANTGWHATLRSFYRTLIRYRRTTPVYACPQHDSFQVQNDSTSGLLELRMYSASVNTCVRFLCADKAVALPDLSNAWKLKLNSGASNWKEPGNEAGTPDGSNAGAPLEQQAWSVMLWESVSV